MKNRSKQQTDSGPANETIDRIALADSPLDLTEAEQALEQVMPLIKAIPVAEVRTMRTSVPYAVGIGLWMVFRIMV